MYKNVFSSTRKCLQKINISKLCARWRTSGLRHTRKCLQKLNTLRVNASAKCEKGVSGWSAKLGKHSQKLSLSAKSALVGLSKSTKPVLAALTKKCGRKTGLVENRLGWRRRLTGRPCAADGSQSNPPNKTALPQQIPEIRQSMPNQADDELDDELVEVEPSTAQSTPTPTTPAQTTNPLDDKPATRRSRRRRPKPEAIRIFGQTRPVKTWKDVLKETADVLYQRHPEQYDETVLQLWGTTKSIAARLEPEELQAPFRPSGAKVWISVHASAANICKAISRLLETLGHHQDSLEIQIADQWHTNTATIKMLASPQASKQTQQHKKLNSR